MGGLGPKLAGWLTAPLLLLSNLPLLAQHVDSQIRTSPEPGIDSSIKPGDDFFAYANGAWLKATSIPAGMPRWGVRNEIDRLTRKQLDDLLAAAEQAPAGSLARKVGDFRAARLNRAAIEQKGLAPVRPLLDSIDHLADKAALARLLGSRIGADVDPLYRGIFQSSRLIGLTVLNTNLADTRYHPVLFQGGLGLGDREQYLATDSAAKERGARYTAYITHLLGAAGYARPDQRAESVLGLEILLAQGETNAEESAKDANIENRWARGDFAREAAGLDWDGFFAAAGLAQQDSFVVWQPAGIRTVAALVGGKSLECWKDYLRFHVLDEYADLLPKAIAAEALAMHGDDRPPELRASAAAEASLSDAVGQLYAERYFPAAAKTRVAKIVAGVIAAFRERVTRAGWMSPASRAIALAKLKALYFGVGYPERWPDHSDLAIDPADPVGNQRRIEAREHRRAVARLGQPVDRHAWYMPVHHVAAVLIFQQNEYNFPAALLQLTKFDPSASDAANYGAIGAIVGHEVSHFVDRLGADYDALGRTRHWWSAEDSTRFAAAVEPLVRQFNGYHPFPDIAVNGALTQVENIADLAGLVSAFDAYRKSLGSRIRDRAYVRAQDRAFFIGFARSWRAKIGDAALRQQTLSSDHAPEMYRIATVRNLDAWYDAFDVRPGDRLYLEPAARAQIW
jgi:predicted metalloendopeptidase